MQAIIFAKGNEEGGRFRTAPIVRIPYSWNSFHCTAYGYSTASSKDIPTTASASIQSRFVRLHLVFWERTPHPESLMNLVASSFVLKSLAM